MLIRTLLIISCCCFAFVSQAEQLIIGGSGTDLSTFRILGARFEQLHPQVRVIVRPSVGSSGGIKAVRKQIFHLGLLSREPRPSERHQTLRFQYYAKTPLVFAVSENSPVDDVTSRQLAEFYSGVRTTWHHGQAARPILRANSDSDTLILRQSFAEFARALDLAYQRPQLVIAKTDQEAAHMIANVPGALGTSNLALIRTGKEKLKALTLNGVNPDRLTDIHPNYPLYKSLFLVYRPTPANKTLQEFLRFLTSDTAKQLLKDTGHIHLSTQ